MPLVKNLSLALNPQRGVLSV